ncbi:MULTISPECIES: Ger(x)C family spore germination C-terminal domain-containing protein [Bacillales]|uniref:Ger(x)C family spore germination C-terminal domain-containing protein n=1 Tax=Bacillales TaxID=1385 RepID=UPI00034A0DF8|nr:MULTISPECIES: Ger(x)C family spore germination C-terminal domain-containing protein [Bacillales]
MPSINPEAKEKIQVFSATGETSKGIRDRINLQSDKRILGGQIRVALYSEKMAKRGLGSIVDTLYRDSSISSHSKIELTQVSPPIFDIHIRLNARILELTLPLKLENARLMKIMEHALEEELRKELQKVVHKLQDLNVDPAGFGIVYRSNRRGKANMTQAEWRKMFKEATFRFHIKSTIIRNGVMD